METSVAIFLGVVLVLILAAAAVVFYARKRRAHHLQSKFGPEYQYTLERAGDRRRAEAQLRHREMQVRRLDIKPLSADERADAIAEWRRIQADFVDHPEGAVQAADRLIGDVMRARGYPIGDFDQRAAVLSVDHPVVVQNYRTAHDIALQQADRGASTEDLRNAMLCYRDLYAELVEDEGDAGTPRDHTTKANSHDHHAH